MFNALCSCYSSKFWAVPSGANKMSGKNIAKEGELNYNYPGKTKKRLTRKGLKDVAEELANLEKLPQAKVDKRGQITPVAGATRSTQDK